MDHSSKNRNGGLKRLLAAVLLGVFLLALLAGCSGGLPGTSSSGKQSSGSSSSGSSSSGTQGSGNSSEDYYPPDDYKTLVPSKLDYGNEEIAKDFSADGWKTSSPSSGTRMTDFGSVVGYWRAVMISDPENISEDGLFTDYFNVEIAGSKSETRVIFNWNQRIMSKTGKVEDFMSVRGGHDGSFSGGAITASGNNNTITLTDFWTDGSTQYAFGKYTWNDGIEGYIGLIRP